MVMGLVLQWSTNFHLLEADDKDPLHPRFGGCGNVLHYTSVYGNNPGVEDSKNVGDCVNDRDLELEGVFNILM